MSLFFLLSPQDIAPPSTFQFLVQAVYVQSVCNCKVCSDFTMGFSSIHFACIKGGREEKGTSCVHKFQERPGLRGDGEQQSLFASGLAHWRSIVQGDDDNERKNRQS